MPKQVPEWPLEGSDFREPYGSLKTGGSRGLPEGSRRVRLPKLAEISVPTNIQEGGVQAVRMTQLVRALAVGPPLRGPQLGFRWRRIPFVQPLQTPCPILELLV